MKPGDVVPLDKAGIPITPIEYNVDGVSTERRKALNDFMEEIRVILVNGHREYGETAEAIYAALGPTAAGYAVAEKGIRFARNGNKKDLVKAATYAFLGWTVMK